MREISGKTGIAELVYQAAIPVIFIRIFNTYTLHFLYQSANLPSPSSILVEGL